MSLLSLPNEILIKNVFSCNNITINDLFQLMLSCRRMYDIIVDSNHLWMCKLYSRWPEKHNQQMKENEKTVWKNWVFSLRIIAEVRKAVFALSSQCYPLGKSVTLLAVERWCVNDGCPILMFAEDELQDLIFNEEIESDLTLFYYARVALKKLRTCFQVRNLKIVMAKPDSQKTLLEGVKLISKWFHFWDQFSYDKLVEVEPLILVDILDNVEKVIQLMVQRVGQLVEESNSSALHEILKCINKVFFKELLFKDYIEDGCYDWNHEAASIHWVLQKRIGYSAVVCVIYLEVATRLGISCEPISIDCADFSRKLIVKCRLEGKADVFYVSICYDNSNDISSTSPTLNGKRVNSFEDLFRHMLEGIVFRDERKLSRGDQRAFASTPLVCSLWPVKANILKYAQLCLESNDQLEDAYQQLLSADIDSNDPVLIECLQKIRSQQAVMDAARVARQRLPSVVYAVGLIMTSSVYGVLRDVDCVIVSWDECFREEVSRFKWGLPFTPLTDGYSLNQPFYHIICFAIHSLRPFSKNFYVPQETLRLSRVGLINPGYLNFRSLSDDLGIFFESFDGHRLVPNAQHKAHFPEDDAFALSLLKI